MSTTTEVHAANAVALSAAREQHARLRAGLVERTEDLIAKVSSGAPFHQAQQGLVDYLNRELLPHIEVEENLLYTGTATPQIALLVQAMQDEHRMVQRLIEELSESSSGTDVLCAASALVVLCDVRIEQEDQLLLPALSAYGLDLAAVLGDHPEIVGSPEGWGHHG